MTKIQEIWKDVVGFEGAYQISSIGRVRSLKRVCYDGKTYKGKILKPWVCANNGYKMIRLYNGPKQLYTTVHSLVCMAFIGEPSGLFCDHINSDKLDNRVENLQYLSNRDNVIKGAVKNASGYLGVRKHGREKTFRYDATIFGFHYSKSGFNTALEASKARERFISETMTKQMETV